MRSSVTSHHHASATHLVYLADQNNSGQRHLQTLKDEANQIE